MICENLRSAGQFALRQHPVVVLNQEQVYVEMKLPNFEAYEFQRHSNPFVVLLMCTDGLSGDMILLYTLALKKGPGNDHRVR